NEFGPYRGEGVLMSWDDARTLCNQGFSIGSHTMSHEPLTGLNQDDALIEIKQSKVVLETRLERAIPGFCYPRGAHSDFLAEAVCQAGYSHAVTTRYGSNDAGTDVFVLRRRNMSDLQGVRARFPVTVHRLELTSLFDRFLTSRRSG
ncbi:polysaccharide deacetylase family protein, partial [Trichloromonas sp.]|uniref:polysaccharide deacetylase family protein n=1 Tax=Trichloromonas sp. TaxID=3069249 RepID=UPI003D8183C5